LALLTLLSRSLLLSTLLLLRFGTLLLLRLRAVPLLGLSALQLLLLISLRAALTFDLIALLAFRRLRTRPVLLLRLLLALRVALRRGTLLLLVSLGPLLTLGLIAVALLLLPLRLLGAITVLLLLGIALSRGPIVPSALLGLSPLLLLLLHPLLALTCNIILLLVVGLLIALDAATRLFRLLIALIAVIPRGIAILAIGRARLLLLRIWLRLLLIALELHAAPLAHRHPGLGRRQLPHALARLGPHIAAVAFPLTGRNLPARVDRRDRRSDHIARIDALNLAARRTFDLSDVNAAVDDAIVHRDVVGDVGRVVYDVHDLCAGARVAVIVTVREAVESHKRPRRGQPGHDARTIPIGIAVIVPRSQFQSSRYSS